MASWKKIITSGSIAELAQVTASAGFSGAGTDITGVLTSNLTGTITNAQLAGSITNAKLAGSIANNKLVNDSVSFGGVSLDLGASDATPAFELTDATINGTAIGTSISGSLGANAALIRTLTAASISGSFTSDSASFSTRITAAEANDGDITAVNAGSGLTDGGSSGAVTLNIGAGTGIDVSTDAIAVDVSDFMTNGSNNRIVTATGADAMNAEANLTFDGSTLSVTGDAVISGDLTVNGDLTTIATTNSVIQDQLMFLGTGSATTNKDIGIVVQSGSADLSGSALYHDTDKERWSVAKNIGSTEAAITPLQHVVTVTETTATPGPTSGDYGVGEMWVDTNASEPTGNGVVYIRTA